MYAFPTYGAAQNIMKALSQNGQEISFIYKYYANIGSIEIITKYLIYISNINLL
jgi:hypothetical protein